MIYDDSTAKNPQWFNPYTAPAHIPEHLPLNLGPNIIANPIEDEELSDDESELVERARVLGTALRRFIETSGIDDPYVLAHVAGYIK